MENYSKLQPLQLYVRKRCTVCINILLDLWLGLGIESQGTFYMRIIIKKKLGLGFTCTCILLVKLIKRLQNIILPDALFLYVGRQPIKTREESNIPYLSVFPI